MWGYTSIYEGVYQVASNEACAAAKVFLDGLGEQLRNLYWKVRIAALNETF